MRTTNALKIATNNIPLVFKNLLYKTIVFLIFSTILGVIFQIRFRPFYDKILPVIYGIKDAIKSFLNGESIASTTLSGSLEDFGTFLSANIGSFVGTGIIVFVAFYLYKFVSGISDCTLMILVNNYMSSISHMSYIRVLTENLKRIVAYQLIDTGVAIVHDVVVGAISFGLAYLTAFFVPIACPFVIVFLSVAGFSLRQTFMGQVMSNMLCGNMKKRNAVKSGLTSPKGLFWRMYSSYAIVAIISIYLTFSSIFFTMGVGAVFVLPFISLTVVCMKQVDYFMINKKKYFIDFDNIVVPKELRENDENLLSDVDI